MGIVFGIVFGLILTKPFRILGLKVLIYSCIITLVFNAFVPIFIFIYHDDYVCICKNIKLNRFSLSGMFSRSPDKSVLYGISNSTYSVLKVFSPNKDCNDYNKCYQAVKSSFELSDNIQNLALCPTLKNVHQLFPYGFDSVKNFNIDLLAEPVLLQLLQTEQGWPFPRLLGVCSTSIIEEYVGPTLSYMNVEKWENRLIIAINLLKMADMLTSRHPTFSFYFTDITPDNLAVRENLDIALIDLDHTIVVDRSVGITSSWNEDHISDSFGNEVDITFSTRDICDHRISDHNFFIICKHILAQSSVLGYGLLENIPKKTTQQFPSLQTYLQDCARGSSHMSRITTGRKLLQVLQNVSSGLIHP